MQKLLGLDLGSYSVKAVEIENDYKSFRLSAFHEVVMLDFDQLVPRSEIGQVAVQQIFKEKGAKGDRVFVGFPSLFSSIRFFEFLNAKKSRLSGLVQNEMEELSLVGEQDHVIDYQIISQHNGVSRVLTVGCVKSYVEALIAELDTVAQHPKIIDVDSLSFVNLIPYLSPLQEEGSEENLLVIDLGHSKTTLNVLNSRGMEMTRTLRLGVGSITEEIQKKFHVSWAEANRLKHKVSLIHFEGSQIQDLVSEDEWSVAVIAGQYFADLIQEIIRTIHSFRVLNGVHVDRIALSGGGSAFKNVVSFFRLSTGFPVELIHVGGDKLDLSPVDSSQVPILAQSLGLACRGLAQKPQSQVNLRKGELSLTGSYDRLFLFGLKIAILALGFFSLLFLTVFFKWAVYHSKIQDLKKDYQKVVQEILDGEPRALKNFANQGNWSLKSYSGVANRLIRQDIAARKMLLEDYQNQRSLLPLEILSVISDQIPKDLTLDIKTYELSASRVLNLVGETEGFSNSEKIFTYLKDLAPKWFKSVDRTQQEAKAGSDGKIVKFKIVAQLADSIEEEGGGEQ